MKTIISIIFGAVLFAASSSVFAVPVNINTADSELIADSLKGIGAKTAKKIVAYRKKNGSYKKASDLMLIPGIGEKKFAKIKSDIRLKGK